MPRPQNKTIDALNAYPERDKVCLKTLLPDIPVDEPLQSDSSYKMTMNQLESRVDRDPSQILLVMACRPGPKRSCSKSSIR
jgi:hypothetical protein